MPLSETQYDLAEIFLDEFNRRLAENNDGWDSSQALESLKERDPKVYDWVIHYLSKRNDPVLLQRLHARNGPNCGVPSCFELVAIIHSGLHRTVWRGIDRTKPNSPSIAVKVFDRWIVEDCPDKFSNLSVIKGFEHDNFVRVWDAQPTADGGFYIAMELLTGDTFATKLLHWRNGLARPNWVVLAGWMEALGEAVDSLYRKHELILCDLKPSNIRFSGGDHGVPKIVDVDAVVKHPKNSKQIGRVSVEGTSIYRSPEHVGRGTIGPWTSVYGLGAVLYACLTGRDGPINPHLDEEKLKWVIQHGTPLPITTKPKEFIVSGKAGTGNGLNQALRIITRKCLYKCPGPWRFGRYSDAGRLNDDIRQAIEGNATDAALFRWCDSFIDLYNRRRRIVLSAACSFAATLLLGLLGLLAWNASAVAQAEANRHYETLLADTLAGNPDDSSVGERLRELEGLRPNDPAPPIAQALLALRLCQTEQDYNSVRTRLVRFDANFRHAAGLGETRTVFDLLIKLHELFFSLSVKDGGFSDDDYQELRDTKKALEESLARAPALRSVLERSTIFMRLMKAAASVVEARFSAPPPIPMHNFQALPKDVQDHHAWVTRVAELTPEDGPAELFYYQGAEHFFLASQFVQAQEAFVRREKGANPTLNKEAGEQCKMAMSAFRSSRNAASITPRSLLRLKARFGEAFCAIFRARSFPDVGADELAKLRKNVVSFAQDTTAEPIDAQLFTRFALLRVLTAKVSQGDVAVWRASENDYAPRHER